jgi:hypothetical protein
MGIHDQPGQSQQKGQGLSEQSSGIIIQDSVLSGEFSIQTPSTQRKSCCASGQHGRIKCSVCESIFCFICNPQPYISLNDDVFSLYFYTKNEIRKFGLMSDEVRRCMAQITSGAIAISLDEQWRRHFENLSIAFIPSRANVLNIGPFCEYHLQEKLNSIYSDAMKRDRQQEAYSLRRAKMQEDYARYREKNPSREEKIQAMREAEEMELYLLANGFNPYQQE